ncbi:MAG: nucleotide exchange factor GrpE, partial [Oligoflexia bacterium]|nr:nucleotide exchange factor GrpE [Oligoflexia bacterium]
MTSKEHNNQDEENINAEEGNGMKGDKDQGNVENAQDNSESGTDVDVSESDEESVKEETQGEEDTLDDLTKEEILELKKKAEERDTYLDQLLRAKAEFMNYQKRMAKESESTSQFAVQSLILDFLPELDNFDRALKLADSTKDIKKFVEGIKLIEEQLFNVLGKYGVEPVETVGKAFDPNLHEAVMEEENNKMP